MSQPKTFTLAEALVEQGQSPLDAEIGRLRQIVDAERRRVSGLVRWTKRVWLFLGVLVVLAILSVPVYMSLGQDTASYRPNASATSTWPRAMDIVGLGFAAVFLMALTLGPLLFVIALVLTILTWFARRTAGMHEMRASLAAVEAQLRVLAAERASDDQGNRGGAETRRQEEKREI